MKAVFDEIKFPPVDKRFTTPKAICKELSRVVTKRNKFCFSQFYKALATPELADHLVLEVSIDVEKGLTTHVMRDSRTNAVIKD